MKLVGGPGGIHINGRCTAYDPTTKTVYHLISRNGWYRFHPPIDRHLDQMQIYMAGLDANAAQLCYVNLGDLADIRLWPPPSADSPYLTPDSEQLDAIGARAEAVSTEIIEHGVAQSAADIPFQKCGCYFCESEELTFPAISESESHPIPTQTHRQTPSNPEVSRPAPPFTLPPPGTITAPVDGYHVPRALHDQPVWVVWDSREKIALAPWQEGHMYPARWSASCGLNPRRTYEKAKMVADLPVETIHQTWPFPDNDLPDEVLPAILLEHEPDRPITVLDFDDVREPDTGEITDEVAFLLDKLNGYTEVSRSGAGLHTYVAGELPGPQTMIRFPLRDRGRVECYDTARFIASTWQHVEGTPLDAVPDAGDTLESLLTTYPQTQ